MAHRIRIRKEKQRHKSNLYRTLIVGFFAIILIGTLLLSLPAASADGEATPVIDAAFTATSATCITGLAVYDTALHWSFFGQAVILALIQVGGLGFMTLGASLILLVRGDATISTQKQIAESLNLSGYDTTTRTLKHVIAGTAAFEGTGALILSLRFIPDFGAGGGIWRGIFTSVSAFCNAGFDLMGTKQPFSSLTDYADDPVVNATVCALILLGGLGFLVWEDLFRRRSARSLSLFSKTVLITDAVLLLLGTGGFFLFETVSGAGGTTAGHRLITGFFQSVAARTAGFSTVDLTQMSEASLVLMIFLMFIGASSGSTGGGVKVSTLAVLFAAILSVLRGQKDVTMFRHRLSHETVYRAFAVFFFPMILVALCSGAVYLREGIPLLSAVFECTSAFATVGSSLSLTPTLSLFSKIILMLLMFAGRVGTLTVFYALLTDRRKRQNTLRYPQGDILIG